jgi:hypothetical protein
MKYTTILSALAIIAKAVSTAISAEVECGALGVMDVSSLPAGTDLSLVRKCAAHPLGDARPFDFDDVSVPGGAEVTTLNKMDLGARGEDACVTSSPLGCSSGYCWKTCGSAGEWCWTAVGDGSGPWIKCQTYTQCNIDQSCGKGCGLGNKSCGCSC